VLIEIEESQFSFSPLKVIFEALGRTALVLPGLYPPSPYCSIFFPFFLESANFSQETSDTIQVVDELATILTISLSEYGFGLQLWVSRFLFPSIAP